MTILQVNKSNSDWVTKQNELLHTIKENNAKITIVSEANVEIHDIDKTTLRKSTFKEYNIEYKCLRNNTKARIAVLLENDIKYTRLDTLESDNNSTIVLKIRQTNRKFFILVATYREWKHSGDEEALAKESIANQIKRMDQIEKIIEEVANLKLPIVWGGDINVDLNPKNDVSRRKL